MQLYVIPRITNQLLSDVLVRHIRLSHPSDEAAADSSPIKANHVSETPNDTDPPAEQTSAPDTRETVEVGFLPPENAGLHHPVPEHLYDCAPLGSDDRQISDGSRANHGLLDFDFPAAFGFDFPDIHNSVDGWATSDFPVGVNFWDSAAGQTITAPDTQPAELGQSAERVRNVQRTWPRKNASSVVKLVHGLWRHAASHPLPNLFSVHIDDTDYDAHPTRPSTGSLLNVDENCRARLAKECYEILLPAEHYTGGVTAPSSPRIIITPDKEIEVEGLSPDAARMTFPSTETLTMSIDFFFRRVHPVLPFIHKPTFEVKQTPSPLLLAICLIGLNRLQPQGAREFIRHHVGKLMRHCRIDLTYKALGKGGAQHLITSLATALLVLYLCLDLDETVDIHQAHMLAIQTLFIADRHGLFRAREGEALDSSVFWHDDPSQSWMAWARVESLKKLILCLILVDCAYTRLLDLAAIIGLDRVEVVLPCDVSLFEALDLTTFQTRSASNAIIMPLTDLTAIQQESSPYDDFSLRVNLAVLSLGEAAARHRLLQNSSILPAAQFVPAKVYRTDIKASIVTQSLDTLSGVCGRSPDSCSPSARLVWNYLCLALSVDVARVHIACGKDGIGPSQQALSELCRWSATANARKAVIHASQIYNITLRYRISHDRTLIHDSMLSTAAMVQAIFIMSRPEHDDVVGGYVDLGEDIDWTLMKRGDANPYARANSTEYTHQQDPESCQGKIEQFLTQGGSFSLGGEWFDRSAMSARKALLIYAQLLDEINSQGTSEHSRLLRSVADYII